MFANSPNNQNDDIMRIIELYLYRLSSDRKPSGIYECCIAKASSVNDFAEQYKNEGHRSWCVGRNRTKSIMIEFDGDYSSISASKFIAIINWFYENMQNGVCLKSDGCTITFDADEKKITFVNKAGKTTQVSLDEFLNKLIYETKKIQDMDIMEKIYNSAKAT